MFLDNIRLAFSELFANKMRSLLTMLGIVIGIASVITIMTLGEGLQNSTMETFGGAQAKQIAFEVIQKDMKDIYDYQNADSDARAMNEGDMFNTKTFDEIESLFGERLAGISLRSEYGTVKTEDDSVSLTGVNSCAFAAEGKMKIVAGRSFSGDEYDNGRKVILISEDSAKDIFGSADAAVGKELEGSLGNEVVCYTIIGVYSKDDSMMSNLLTGGSNKKQAYIPYRAGMKTAIEDQCFDYFITIAKDSEDIPALEADMSKYLNSLFENNDTYKVASITMQSQLEMVNSELGLYKMILAAIAAISLLVGGIGVMNIMIVSITERTREIGTRKALGATNTDIRIQFLIEAIIICLVGSAIGIGLGLGGGAALCGAMGISGIAPAKSILLSVLFSMAFGVFFGFYPANKAAKLNPIDALRYE